jgi:hypothetical protein
MTEIGKLLFIIGGFIALLGLLIVLVQHIPFIGKLPGDIVIKKDGFSLYLPVVTFLLLSTVLTIIVNLILYLLNR